MRYSIEASLDDYSGPCINVTLFPQGKEEVMIGMYLTPKQTKRLIKELQYALDHPYKPPSSR